MSERIARVHYFRVLAQFGCLVEGARKHRRLTIDQVAELSAISVRRLKKYEAALAPPHWADALRLAMVLGIRMSFISAVLKKPLMALSLQEYKSLLAFVREQAAEQRKELQADLCKDRLIHWEDCWDVPHHDISIMEWPEFLPPFLGDALMAEASQLHTMLQMLQLVADCKGPLTIHCEGHRHVSVDAAAVLSRVHYNMDRIRNRLQSLIFRHQFGRCANFSRRVEIQRLRIAQAMGLIMPGLWNPTSICTSAEHAGAELVRADRADDGLSLLDLHAAIDRSVLASYGVTKIARRAMFADAPGSSGF